jgi:hypothetical protein
MAMLLLALVLCADAHITFSNAGGAKAGQEVLYELNVPHAAEGHVTIILEVTFPAGVRSVAPRNKPGWSTTVELRDLAPEDQFVAHGALVNKTVARIIFAASRPTTPSPTTRARSSPSLSTLGATSPTPSPTRTGSQGTPCGFRCASLSLRPAP